MSDTADHPLPTLNGDDVPVKVSLCGVYAVRRALADTELDGVVFGLPAGTGVAYRVVAAGMDLVALDEEGSGVAAFGDDAGGDLLVLSTGEAARAGWSNPFGTQGEALVAELSVRNSPLPGASALVVRGELSVLVADGTEAREVLDVRLAPGPVAAGDLPLEITHVGAPTLFGGARFAVKFTLRGEARHRLRDLRLLDEDGREVSTMEGRNAPEPGVLEVETYLDEEIPTYATVLLSLWKDLRRATVPVADEVRLGLPA